MSNRSNGQRRRATSLLATTTTLLAGATFAKAQNSSQQSALIAIEASSGGAGSNLHNTTLSIPLRTLYTNDALDTVSTLFLTGSTNVDTNSITCYPFKNDDLTGQGGSPFTYDKPSLLSTNTVPVGSILCNSTDVQDQGTGEGGDASGGVTSTLHATTTELTRGSPSDVPNLSVPLGPGPVIISTTRSDGAPPYGGGNTTMTTSSSTSSSSTTSTSEGSASQSTVTSVAVITATGTSGGSPSMVTSTSVQIVNPTPTDTGATGSPSQSGSPELSNTGGAVAGKALDLWGMTVVGLLGWIGVAILGA